MRELENPNFVTTTGDKTAVRAGVRSYDFQVFVASNSLKWLSS